MHDVYLQIFFGGEGTLAGGWCKEREAQIILVTYRYHMNMSRKLDGFSDFRDFPSVACEATLRDGSPSLALATLNNMPQDFFEVQEEDTMFPVPTMTRFLVDRACSEPAGLRYNEMNHIVCFGFGFGFCFIFIF